MEEKMRKVLLFAGIIISWVICTAFNSYAATIYLINPSDDGTIYANGVVDTHAYLLTAGTLRGVVEFPLPWIPAGDVEKALLSINPYGEPVWCRTINVYGYGSNDGMLAFADYNAGAFLGVWTLPDPLAYGQDAFFDVTDFVSGTNTPFIGFNLRADDVGVFSSLEYNYGHPAQLKVDVVPEPATMLLLPLGLAGFRFFKRRKA